MPFDPISAAVAGGGMILDFLKSQGAAQNAREGQAFQRQALMNALSDARMGKADALRAAGGLRLDQFGNATYYDPTQGRWITSFSPTQQRIIDEGQARQRRAQIRGAQASEDYDTLRGQYLYRRPKSEAESYSEIVNLLNQAMGTGERALNTLTNRFGVRTRGNVPIIEQLDRGPSPGQQLAETMLNARKAALEEYGTREKVHQSRYLPALKQFEDTANYVAPIDPTGSGIVSMMQQGMQDYLKSGSDYDKLLATIAGTGARSVGSATDAVTKAMGGGPGSSDFLNLAKMLMPGQDKTAAGTVGGTRGARAGSGGGDGIGGWDRRFNYLMTNDTEKGAGGEAAGLGGRSGFPDAANIPDISTPSIWANPAGDPNEGFRSYGNPFGLADPYGNASIQEFGPGQYWNPWQF